MSDLLAVDLGVRTGLARYGPDGRLRWYRSHNFGSASRLRRAVPALLEGVRYLVVEGGGDLATIWAAEADARGIDVRWVVHSTPAASLRGSRHAAENRDF